MESEEHGHEDGNHAIEHVCYLYYQIFDQLLLVFSILGEVVRIQGPLDALNPCIAHGDHHEVSHQENIDEQ